MSPTKLTNLTPSIKKPRILLQQPALPMNTKMYASEEFLTKITDISIIENDEIFRRAKAIHDTISDILAKKQSGAPQLLYYYTFEYFKIYALSHIFEHLSDPKTCKKNFKEINKTTKDSLIMAFDYITGYYGNAFQTDYNQLNKTDRVVIENLLTCFNYIMYFVHKCTDTENAKCKATTKLSSVERHKCNECAVSKSRLAEVARDDSISISKKIKSLNAIGITGIIEEIIPNSLAKFPQFSHLPGLLEFSIKSHNIDQKNYINVINYIKNHSKTVLSDKFKTVLLNASGPSRTYKNNKS